MKTLVSQEKFASIDFKNKKICLKITRIFNLENVICIFTKNLVNVAMKMEAFYNISMHLDNKNVIENAQIARSGPKSMILTIEGSSTK